ncbi:glycosyltransferase family 4 protein [Cereibacter sphaeroides]|uniref:glycosyltransferase family 4 protein n=1 Tax=Cereibacter sphaeroides TaxID=1063 RepID=UPI001F2A1EE2|nr:glycosyltransferase family 4 protein [Cereibacter sphaeroides]MCE6957952.1 glycosyltransferase family 4 protein [Cereibacter sphaeroides]MCE6972297.1 glycosyltransferase family 4 protein [Cereibacter sphaeroides]
MTEPRLTVLMTLDAVGGVWRYAMDLAAGLAGQVRFVFAGFGPEPTAEQRREAAALGTLEWCDAPLDWLVSGEAELAVVPKMIAGVARQHRVDLIHLNLPTQAAGLSVPVPVLAVAHSCVVTWFAAMRDGVLPSGWLWQRRLNRLGLASADVVVTPTRAHADLMLRAYGPLPEVRVVPNASRHAPPVRRMAQPMVLAAGRWWDEGKNAAVLDAATPLIGWKVMMAGATASPVGQEIAIRYAESRGELPHGEVLDLMRDAAIFVSPSRYEPFGLAVLEAARGGLPLVLADIPTFRELWEGAAEFFPPQDPVALAAAVNRLIRDPSRRRQLGQAAAGRASLYTPDRQACAMAAIYTGLCPIPETLRAAR